MQQRDRWYITFHGVNVISLLPPRVTEPKAVEVAWQQYDIMKPLGAESVTLKFSARLYDK